jgi:hypothetical protein
MAFEGPQHRAMTPEWLHQLLILLAGIGGSGAIWYLLSNARKHEALWVGFACSVLLLLVITLYIRNGMLQQATEVRKPVYAGFLTPSKDAAPPLPKDTPEETVSLLLGDDLRVLTGASNRFILSIDGESFLKIGVRDGKMRLSCLVADPQGNVIARVIDGEFQAMAAHAFNPQQPDPHTLRVRDGRGVEVLNVRFLNSRAIWLTGRFNLPGLAGPVVVSRDRGIQWPGGGGLGSMTIDMTQARAGLIEFSRSGRIQLLP